jgi:hypothetical protein
MKRGHVIYVMDNLIFWSYKNSILLIEEVRPVLHGVCDGSIGEKRWVLSLQRVPIPLIKRIIPGTTCRGFAVLGICHLFALILVP